MKTDVKLSPRLSAIQGVAPIAAVVGIVGGLGLAFLLGNREYFFRAYLYAFLLWGGMSIGAIALLCIHHMTAGAWSFVAQRIFEAMSRIVKYLAVLFIPILLGPLVGLHHMYDAWVNPVLPIVMNKAEFLRVDFWALRAVLYFAIWIYIAGRLNGWSRQLEETGDALITLKFRTRSPIWLITYCLTMTFAAVDWYMSLSPEWFSTIYGPLFWISQGLTIFTFTVLVLASLAEQKPLSEWITVEHYYLLSTFMLAFTVLWAYMSFSQYLIIWAGNLPEEIGWYLNRSTNFNVTLSLALMLFHFFVPLMLLLQRQHIKNHISRLKWVCYFMLLMRCVDVFWIINPSFYSAFHDGDYGVPWSEIIVHLAVFIGFGGIWMTLFLRELTKMPLLPLKDPRFHEAVTYGGHVEEGVAEHA